MQKHILLFLLTMFSFPIVTAQEPNNVKYSSKDQYLVDRDDGEVVDEQSEDIHFSLIDGNTVVLQEYDNTHRYDILECITLPAEGGWEFELENNQFLRIDEKEKAIEFGHQKAKRMIRYDVAEKTKLEAAEKEKLVDGAKNEYDDDELQAKEFFKKGEYDKAKTYFKKAAEQGNTEAMNNLAYMNIQGKSGEPNPSKALKWFKKAAEKGDETAMYNAGLVYDQGVGDIEVNKDKALQWYKKAADKDYGLAKYNIGYLYYSSEGEYQDYEKALKWFKAADELDEAAAGYYLGEIYLKGLGVSKDREKAKKWFQRSADLGVPEAQEKLGNW